jgi:trypsin
MCCLCACCLWVPATALVGAANEAYSAIRRHTVMIYRAQGACSAAVVAQDLLLTAAHCTKASEALRVIGYVADKRYRVGDVEHFEEAPQATDLALLKLVKPLQTTFSAPFLTARPVAIGDQLIVVGYGLNAPNDGKTFGTARMALVTVIRRSADSISLIDPRNQMLGPDEGNRVGSCNGDSGAPVFAVRGTPLLVGIVSRGDCRSYTDAVPLAPHMDWLAEASLRLGSPLNP